MNTDDERNLIHAELTRAKINHAGIKIEADGIAVSLWSETDAEVVQAVLEFNGYVPADAVKNGISGRWTIAADRLA